MKTQHAIIAVLAGVLTVVSQIVISDDDEHEHGQRKGKFFERTADVAPVQDAQYKKECGECHFAYQPGLLPERSWRKVMGNLKNHFGDNAELPAPLNNQILSYLVFNSAEHGGFRRSEKILKSLSAGDAPERITDTPYIRRQHDELSDRLVKANDKVGSLSNCNACHTRAEQGSYSEGEIKIPGRGGSWD